MKRIIALVSVFAVICSVFALCTVSASAGMTFGECGPNAYWSYDSTTRELVVYGDGYVSDFGAYNFPWERQRDIIRTVRVAEEISNIPDWAFADMPSLTTVEISSNVRSIGNHAFSSCFALEGVYIPSSVTELGMDIFAGCTGMQWVVFEEGCEYISERMFYGCHTLWDVTVPTTVTGIGMWAFNGCSSLKSIYFPSGTHGSLDNYFENCHSLETVYFNSREQVAEYINGDIEKRLGDTKIEWVCFSVETADSFDCLGKGGISTVMYNGDIYYAYEADDWQENISHIDYYEYDEYSHIAVCESCGRAGLSEDHYFNESVIIIEPTTQSFGIMEWRCVCGAARQEEIATLIPDIENSIWFEEGEGNHIAIKPVYPDYEGGMSFDTVTPNRGSSVSAVLLTFAAILIGVLCLGGLAVAAVIAIIIVLIVRKKKKSAQKTKDSAPTEIIE